MSKGKNENRVDNGARHDVEFADFVGTIGIITRANGRTELAYSPNRRPAAGQEAPRAGLTVEIDGKTFNVVARETSQLVRGMVVLTVETAA